MAETCSGSSASCPLDLHAPLTTVCRGAAGACDPVETCTARGVAPLGMSGGFSHMCAMLSDGTAMCWGYNRDGQLGDGTTVTRTAPVLVSGLTGVLSLSTHYNHTCAAVAGGFAKCWGDNSSGQLGNGTQTNTAIPVSVLTVAGGPPLSGVKAISAGYWHTCALLTDGTARCWGYNVDGQLGDGSTAASLDPVTVTDSTTVALTGINSLAAGGLHTCASHTAGTVSCWGWNEHGQLGNGTTTNSARAVAVSSLGSPNALATSVAVTSRSSCAQLSDGSSRCWGDNAVGQLGDGTTVSRTTPGPTWTFGASCPPNLLAPATTVCRGSAGVCDVAESCSGINASCPANTFVAAGAICRGSAGVCDGAEACTGAAASCPPDLLAPATTMCRAVAGLCDLVEMCSGAATTCPSNLLVPANTVCRPSAGVCDPIAEVCSGTATTCPPDLLAPANTACRAAAGPCDVPDSCDGSTSICANAFVVPGTLCRSRQGPCDVDDWCSGVDPACANRLIPAGAVCDALGLTCDGLSALCLGSTQPYGASACQ